MVAGPRQGTGHAAARTGGKTRPLLVGRDTNFYYSFLVLPPEKRRAIVGVWDFCRVVDDAVDEAATGATASEVARWRNELAAAFDGGSPQTPQGRALAPLVTQF